MDQKVLSIEEATRIFERARDSLARQWAMEERQEKMKSKVEM